jgi:hypothetical protein
MTKQRWFFRALSLCLPLIALAAHAEEQIQAPVFKEGDSWRYTITTKLPPNYSPANELWSGIYVMQYMQGAVRLRKVVDEKQVPADGGILIMLGLREGVNENPLQFPLYVGKQWRYFYKTEVTHTVNVEVVAEEEVTTRAGIFRALKIERTRQYAIANQRWGTAIRRTPGTYYYSPRTKSIVKYDSVGSDGITTLSMELLSFKLAP